MSLSHAAEIGNNRASLRMDEVLGCMSEIIFTKDKRRRLLELRDSDAQPIIDYLNTLLSHRDFLELGLPELRKHILIVLQKICEKSMLYPTCYALDGIEDISLKGAGGFCDIYQGRYQGQNLCLKVVRLYEKKDQHEMLKAHSREAILWSQLEHPNIAPFYGIFCLKEVHERIYLLSPWMENGNIVEYLKEESRIPHRPFLHDIASGLEYLHNENVVHGDLKGVNVLVDQFLSARLTDFGLSKITTDGTLGFINTTKLASGRTTGWASPELLEDDARPTRESDIWAFGCVCYEVLTGLLPFHRCSDVQIVRKLLGGYLPAQSADTRLDSDDVINQKIWQLVEQCWSSEPKKRPKCSEILRKMENDPVVWQLRTRDSNIGTERRPQFQNRDTAAENLLLSRARLKQLFGDLLGDLQVGASLAEQRRDAAVSPSVGFDPPRPSPRLGSLERDVIAPFSVSRPSVLGYPIHSQESTGRLVNNRAPRPITPIDVVPSDAVHVLNSDSSIVPKATHLASPSDRTDSSQTQQPLPNILATTSQQSLNHESLIPLRNLDSSPLQNQHQGLFSRANSILSSLIGLKYGDEDHPLFKFTRFKKLDRRSTIILQAARSQTDPVDKKDIVAMEDPGIDALRGSFGTFGSIARARRMSQRSSRMADLHPRPSGATARSGLPYSHDDPLRGMKRYQLYDAPVRKGSDTASLGAASITSLNKQPTVINFASQDDIHFYNPHGKKGGDQATHMHRAASSNLPIIYPPIPPPKSTRVEFPRVDIPKEDNLLEIETDSPETAVAVIGDDSQIGVVPPHVDRSMAQEARSAPPTMYARFRSPPRATSNKDLRHIFNSSQSSTTLLTFPSVTDSADEELQRREQEAREMDRGRSARKYPRGDSEDDTEEIESLWVPNATEDSPTSERGGIRLVQQLTRGDNS